MAEILGFMLSLPSHRMVILRHLLPLRLVDTVIDGKRIGPVGPDQCYQTNPLHDFVMIPAPLEIRQFNLF